MDLRNLTTFIQVAESGSFTKAAEKLGYAQPTISFQIKQLENELGAPLFERIGHNIMLTDRGHQVLRYAQTICRMTDEMINGSDNEENAVGTIRIAMADSLCTPLIEKGFALFREKHPGVSLKVSTAGTDVLYQLIDRNEADVVCTLDTHIFDTSYVIASEEKIGAHFVCSTENPLSKMATVTLNELCAFPFLLTEKGMSYRRLMDERLAEEKIEVSPILEISSADIISSLIEQNAGVSFLPDYVTENAVKGGKIVRLAVENFDINLWKQLLYHRDKWLSLPLKAVIDHLSGILFE